MSEAATHPEAVVERYQARWQAGDLPGWASLFTEDADFVTWRGLWWKGRREILAGHQAVDAFVRGQFAAYRIEPLRIRSLGPAVAVAHAGWRWPGFREDAQAPAEDRAGLVTMVLSFEDGWLISASHNTRTA
ncbi:SgcJ/EcaC family oxidoreductase [Inquilinus limosus]|uniref:SgcJ/EcaC family oxidoreductase n=1 Tax=Inquilinus limosus TaxID=171674 RepID=UPI003F191785